MEAAKAAFFLRGGKVQPVPTGVGQYSVNAAPPEIPYGRKRIKPSEPKSTRANKPVTPEEEDAIAAQLIECQAKKITQNAAAKLIGISTTLMRRIIEDRAIHYPKAR